MLNMDNEQYHRLISQAVFGLKTPQKHEVLLDIMHSLHIHHRLHCAPYRRLFGELNTNVLSLEELPYLAVRLFKMMTLRSIPKEAVFRSVVSSGTSGQIPSKIFLDRATSTLQTKILTRIFQEFVGGKRIPMLLVDAPASKHKEGLSTRLAAVQGFRFLGRDYAYALNEDYALDRSAIEQFCEKYQDKPVLLFGFTGTIYQDFLCQLSDQKVVLNLNEGVLIHGGGWKKLQDKAVDNDTFKQMVAHQLGIQKVHNYYGMAEQLGSVFVECEQGVLHAPATSEVIVRDPINFKVKNIGDVGILQLMSVLPVSYPGFSLLTEDLGVVLGEDDCPCGRLGRYFKVQGRMPRTELRGCSDVMEGV